MRDHRIARLLRAAGIALVAALVVLSGVGPAVAGGPSGTISEVRVANGRVQMLFAGQSLPYGVGLSMRGISVTVDGTPLQATASSAATSPVLRTAVLTIDRSGSMAGQGIAGARAAAHAFVAALPADVAVGVVAFSDTPSLLIAPTRNRAAVSRAIDGIVAGGNTALYDALTLALHAAGPVGQRRIVLLSDGADTVSRTPLPKLLTALDRSGATLDAVGFRTRTDAGSVLSQLTGAAGGSVYAATSATGLAVAFSAAAQAFVSQLFVSAQLPAQYAGHAVTVTVTARTSEGQELTDTALVQVPAVAAASHAPSAAAGPSSPQQRATTLPSSLSGTLVRNVGVGALFLALLLLGAIALDGRFGGSKRKRERDRLIDSYSYGAPQASAQGRPEEEQVGNVARGALDLSERILRSRGWEQRLKLMLDRAGVKMRPNEWALLQVIAAVVVVFVLALAGAPMVLAVPGAIVLALAGPVLFLRVRAERRRTAFLSDLPDALTVLAGSLATGYSLDQAVDALVVEAREPIAGEFTRALAASRLGVPLEDALQETADRMALEEFDWIVMAIKVQREVGGSLAEVLRTVASTIRDRERLRRQVRALSAEGRISAVILVALPIAVGLFFFAFEGSYLRPLYTTAAGYVMLATAAVMLTIGWFWMRKLAQVEV